MVVHIIKTLKQETQKMIAFSLVSETHWNQTLNIQNYIWYQEIKHLLSDL